MYYIWERDARNDTDKFFDCGLQQFDGWADAEWMFGEKITQTLPNPLPYNAKNMMEAPDYPMVATGGGIMLISGKIASILQGLNVPNIDYYPSVIVRPNGEIIEDYYTINILNVIECVDFDKSDYEKRIYPRSWIPDFRKMVLDEKLIDKGITLFRLKERRTLVAVHESIVKECEKQGVTGINFISVKKYKD